MVILSTNSCNVRYAVFYHTAYFMSLIPLKNQYASSPHKKPNDRSLLRSWSCVSVRSVLTHTLCKTVLWLWMLVASLSLWTPKFNSGTVHVRFVEGKSGAGTGFSPSTLVLPIFIIPPILSIHLYLGTAVTRKTSGWRPETFKQGNVPSNIKMCMQKKGNSRKQCPSRDADSASASQEICHILWNSKVHFPAPNSLNLSLS
jgi:hypothetical protein